MEKLLHLTQEIFEAIDMIDNQLKSTCPGSLKYFDVNRLSKSFEDLKNELLKLQKAQKKNGTSSGAAPVKSPVTKAQTETRSESGSKPPTKEEHAAMIKEAKKDHAEKAKTTIKKKAPAPVVEPDADEDEGENEEAEEQLEIPGTEGEEDIGEGEESDDENDEQPEPVPAAKPATKAKAASKPGNSVKDLFS